MVPWVPEVFPACGRNFRCWPGHYKDLTETGNRDRKVSGYYKDLTETGNRDRKVSGTQGKLIGNAMNESRYRYLMS